MKNKKWTFNFSKKNLNVVFKNCDKISIKQKRHLSLNSNAVKGSINISLLLFHPFLGRDNMTVCANNKEIHTRLYICQIVQNFHVTAHFLVATI